MENTRGLCRADLFFHLSSIPPGFLWAKCAQPIGFGYAFPKRLFVSRAGLVRDLRQTAPDVQVRQPDFPTVGGVSDSSFGPNSMSIAATPPWRNWPPWIIWAGSSGGSFLNDARRAPTTPSSGKGWKRDIACLPLKNPMVLVSGVGDPNFQHLLVCCSGSCD